MGSTCMKKAEHTSNVICDDSIIGYWIAEIILIPILSLRENNGSLMNVFSLAASCGGPLTRGSKMEGTIVQWKLHHTHKSM
jgi:hypothetical protein